MPTQEIIWTALPNGLAEGSRHKLKLSVFITPRLRFDGHQKTGNLGAFPDFLDWPQWLRSTDFAIKARVSNGVSFDTSVVTKTPPDSVLWKKLFSAATFVRARQSAPMARHFRSYPASELSTNLSGGYAELVKASPFSPVSNAALSKAFPDLYNAVRTERVAGESPMLQRLSNTGTLPEAELHELRRDLGKELLRHDPDVSFADKLSAAVQLAEGLTRSPHARPAIPVIPKTSSPASAFAQFAAFHHRASKSRLSVDLPSHIQVDDPPTIDFHQMLSALGEYPDLMRRLGLVIDLELDAHGFPKSVPGDLKGIRVEPSARIACKACTPVTNYLFDAQPSGGSLLPFPHFTAAPRGSGLAGISADDVELIGGLLNLSLPRPQDPDTFQFDLLPIDIDGAVSKLLNAINAIAAEGDPPKPPVGGLKEAGPPTIRTSGISIVRADHAEELLSNIPAAERREAALQKDERLEFFAEDLVRGYRIDVKRFPANHVVGSPDPPSAHWLSLHERIGTFTFGFGSANSVKLENIAEEGFVQPVLVQDLDETQAKSSVRVHESLLNWRGWSLTAPPPANPIDDLFQAPAGASAQAPTLPNVKVEFEAKPKSLPRLRFGNYYQFRARTVDLAGSGPTLIQADDLIEALRQNSRKLPILFEKREDFFRYRRFEPIDAPTLILHEELSDGEDYDILVIRSRGAAPDAASQPTPTPSFNTANERHIVPPKATQMLIEAHGLLDGAFGPGGRPQEHYKICKKESRTLNDTSVINIETGEAEALPDVIKVDAITGAEIRIKNGVKFISLSASDYAQGYTIHYEEQLRLPYLPDPFARGAALFGLPGVVAESGHLLEDGSLEWIGSDGQFLPDDAIKTLGYVTKISFGNSSRWHERLPFRLRLKEIAGDADPEKPSWNPSERVLTVRLAPGHQQITCISSYPDKSDVPFMGVHNWSLARVGHQTDSRHFNNTAPHGALSMLSPARKLLLVHAVQRPVHRPIETPLGSFRAVKLMADDTVAYIGGKFKIHNESSAKLDLLAMWKEPGEGAGGADYRALNTHVFEVPIHLEGPAPTVPDGQVPIYQHNRDTITFLAPGDENAARTKRYLARHEFGDAKYRRVTYRLVATSRFREYFPKAIADDAESISCSTQITLDVDSSASPAAPEISYIVPAFQWGRIEDESVVLASKRQGGGLRVYLGTTWHSSGDGEQLAIIESPELTAWGADPIHHVGAALVAVKPTIDPVIPPDQAGVKVYPYDVFYDEEAELWCCDLSFNIDGAYFPFIKLVLARYQKHSLRGKHLSSKVYAGFHQLAPNRTVSLLHSTVSATQREIAITVVGSRPAAAQLPAGSGRVEYLLEVSLEERAAARRDWDENFGWKPARREEQPVAEAVVSPTELWRGHVFIAKSEGNKQRRLVIREFELFPQNACPPGQAWLVETPGGADEGRFSRRLVHADTIPLV